MDARVAHLRLQHRQLLGRLRRRGPPPGVVLEALPYERAQRLRTPQVTELR